MIFSVCYTVASVNLYVPLIIIQKLAGKNFGIARFSGKKNRPDWKMFRTSSIIQSLDFKRTFH